MPNRWRKKSTAVLYAFLRQRQRERERDRLTHFYINWYAWCIQFVLSLHIFVYFVLYVENCRKRTVCREKFTMWIGRYVKWHPVSITFLCFLSPNRNARTALDALWLFRRRDYIILSFALFFSGYKWMTGWLLFWSIIQFEIIQHIPHCDDATHTHTHAQNMKDVKRKKCG